MNQLCRVCGEPAAGFHFGAFTCEGCKSFFGRTYSNLNSISECKNNGECVINKKNRTSCKACRLRKCLLVGMSKSGSRYGRRSNWFKIHCLLAEKQQELQQQQQAAVAAASGVGNAPTCLSPMNAPRDQKGNAAGTLWGAKTLAERDAGKPTFQMEAKPLAPASPPRQTAAPPLPVTVPGYPGDAAASAAAFWAQARGSLLQLPTPHLSGLPVPFLTPPFLHGAAAGFHPYQHKGFLLPFLPAEPPPTASRPARAPSPAAGHRRPQPPPGCGRRSASSGGCSSEGVSPPPSPPAPPATAPPSMGLPAVGAAPPPPSSAQPPTTTSSAAAAAAAATALMVESLRALGPMQERPLDLSLKGSSTSGFCSSRRHAAATSDSDSGADEDEDDDMDEDMESREFDDEDDVFSEDPAAAAAAGEDGGEDKATLQAPPEAAAAVRRTPLDLTTRA